jgi:hypothetical protein
MLMLVSALGANTSAEGILDKFKDPDDGWIDMRAFLLDGNLSFLPVPIVVTEPALGGDIGLAGAFFHRPPEGSTTLEGEFLRPSISAVAALVTSNESWVVATWASGKTTPSDKPGKVAMPPSTCTSTAKPGGDFDYVGYEAKYNNFWQVHEKFVLGARLDGTTVNGDAPFIAEPFIQLRGIPMMRYQGESVVTTEVEGRWDFHPRISLVVFAGAGRASRSFDDLGSAGTEATGRIGLRYFMAKVLGLRGGLDVARGPEETAVYLTIGQAWGQ